MEEVNDSTCTASTTASSSHTSTSTTSDGLPRFDAVLLLLGLIGNLTEDHPENRHVFGSLGVVDLISDVSNFYFLAPFFCSAVVIVIATFL